MEQLSHNHKRSDNPLYASSEEMEMEPFSPNHKRGLTRNLSDVGYGQFSEEVVGTSQVKSHSQEISSQTGPDIESFLTEDVENKKDLLEKSHPKDKFQGTIPPSESPIGENMPPIEGRAPDYDHQNSEKSSDKFQRAIPLSENHCAPDYDHQNWEKSSVIEQEQEQGVSYGAPPTLSDFDHKSDLSYSPRHLRRRSVSPPLRRRFHRPPSISASIRSYSELESEDGIGPQSYGDHRMEDFETSNSLNPADLVPSKPHFPKPGDVKKTNEETLSKEKDNRASSAQLDDVNYTRASNVTLSNFVSVKLSGKSNYDMWKAQMVCLMKIHKMRGLVIKGKELPDIELRERYEILLNGWLIGSLSEEIIKDTRIYNKGAKGIWDTLEQSYDPYAISPTASTLLEPRGEKENQGTGIELKLIKKLHNATLEGHWWKAKSILNECQGAATWEINVNHDTLLHVAVRLGNNYFLEKMLDVIHTEKEIEKANSEGHTALHTAAIVGNKEAAELLVEKRKELLSIEDNDSMKPLACAKSNKQVNVFVYLWGATEKSDPEGLLSENKEKEKENENEKDKDKRKEKENEEEKEKEEGKVKENGKENQIKKEKEIENENEKEKDKRKERVNEKEKRIEEGKEDENEKEKGKKEGKGNEIEKEKGKGIVNKNEKVKEKEQEGQKEVKSLLNTAIHDKQYDLAMELVKIYPNLAKQPSTLVVLTRNFPSQISFTETLMYPSLNDVCRKLVKRSFLHSLENLYARARETLWKMRRAVQDKETEKLKLYGFTRFKNKYYYSLFPELIISLLVPAAVLYLIYRLLCLLILLLRLPFSMLYFILWKVLAFLVVPIKNLEKKRKEHKEAKKFLKLICSQNRLKDKNSIDSPFDKFYKESLMEAACLDVYEVLDQILKLSSNAMNVKNKDGHYIIQLAVINRSAKVYNLLTPIIEGKGSYRRVMDAFGNNLLHLAGRLAPLAVLSCTSGAALQLQRELQWREEVEKLIEPTQHTDENVDYETPKMVFSREHASLVKEGEKWMKTTAESCSITAALIITIVFAAAITVPGGSNQETGIPLFKRRIAFNIFAVADAISLFSASTSLLVFLSILTTRFAEKDFLISLPRRLFIGLCLLFLSTTAMMLAFSSILFLVFCEERPWMLAPIGGLTCFPIAAIVTLQLPLVIDLYQATFITIFGKEPNEEDEEEDEEEDKEKRNEEADNKKQANVEEEEKQKIQNIERDNNSILKRLSTACCLPLHQENKPIPKRSSTKFCLPLHRGNL